MTATGPSGKLVTLPEPGGGRWLGETVPHWDEPKQRFHLAVCIASRGVGHYRTIAGVIREVEAAGVQATWCWALGQPIPDAQNEITRQGLASGASALWFVEDDQLLPAGVLAAMLAAYTAGNPIVTVDYRTRANTLMVGRHPSTGEVLLTPMGCLLVAREVFGRISDPPFQVGNIWELQGGRWHETRGIEHTGGQDGHFSREVIRAGYWIHALDDWEAGHLDVVRAGGRVNYGMDQVRCFGGAGDLPWMPAPIMRPQRRAALARMEAARRGVPVTRVMEGSGMASVYVQSPKGTVLEFVDERFARPYLRRKWVQISKAQFDKALAAQTAHREQRKDQQIRELREMDE